MNENVASPWSPFPPQQAMLQQVRAFFCIEEGNDLQSLAAGKIEYIRHFNAAEMKRGVAITACGRSGSILLASYLDGHDDVLMLPSGRSVRIYEFFERYPSVSLYDKLIGYAILTHFFRGEFAIAATDYCAAVAALIEVYGKSPPEFLETRRAFVQFVHVVYCAALGWRPASRQPLIVYALHDWNDKSATRFLEDFPQARFIHTVRDPITSVSRGFDSWWGGEGFSTARHVIRHQTKSDKPHTGMEARSRAIRFEDLHLHLERTMCAIADWLDLPYRSSLLESTFNGVRWGVKREATSWSGANPDQAIRDSKNISFTDRCLLFAVLYEDFLAWNYPCSGVFKHRSIRVLVCMLVLFIPMKIEIIIVRRLIKALHAVGWGDFRYAINVLNPDGNVTELEGGIIQAVIGILTGRLAIMAFLAIDLWRRLAFKKKILKLL